VARGDIGTEFDNKHVKEMVDSYSTENEEKSGVLESWIRTMKRYMFVWFSTNKTRRYVGAFDVNHCKKLNQFLTVCQGHHDRGNDT
jgi:hypothetical protein